METTARKEYVMTEPPRLASWLLNQFLLGERRDSLIGDLTERYAARPSPVWFWRQSAAAIVMSFLAQAIAHIWLVLAVLALSLLLPKAYVLFVVDSVLAVQQTLSAALLNWFIDGGVIWLYDYIMVVVEFGLSLILCVALSGLAFLLVRLRPQERGLMLSVLIVSCIVQGLPDLSRTVSEVVKAPTSLLWVF